jgi:hypothetical protein
MGKQINKFSGRLKKHGAELLEEIREQLVKSEHEPYAGSYQSHA